MAENKLMQQFGCSPITWDLLTRIESVTKQPVHTFLRRGLFFSHRDLEKILEDYEAGRPIYLYTGRGPSAGSFHLGHLVPFLFTAYLQRVFDAEVVIQITDDEKFLANDKMSIAELDRNADENIRDIIACGFNPEKTFIFKNFEYMAFMYQNVVRIQAKITNNQAFATFGITGSDSIGKTAFCATQAAPILPSSFPFLPKNARCLVPQGIDQDPYFRIARDVAPRLKVHKPSLIHSRFVPSLQGVQTKMSSSKPETAIFVTDTPKQIKKKINAAFSGGCELKEEQLEKGANVDVDVPFLLLTYFMQSDDELKLIEDAYSDKTETKPKMLSGQVKKKAIEVIRKLIRDHQDMKAMITDDLVEQFCSVRLPGD